MKMMNLFLMTLLMSSSLAYAVFNPNIFKTKTPATPITQVAPTNSTQVVDINQANANELMSLKGIGEKKAEAIIAYRQQHGVFKSVNDLAQVQGFGEKKLAALLKKNENRIRV